jgi:His-Xaa-Ser system protein HxsD
VNDNIPVTHLAVGDYTVVRVPLADACEEDLQAVAIRLSDVAGIEISEQQGQWLITISAFSHAQMESVDIARHFSNGLIDQKLRRSISEQTSNERTLILSYAFSNTQLISNNESE